MSYRKTPVDLWEKLAFKSSDLPLLFEKLKASEHIAGCVIISTCNDTEIYAASKDADAAIYASS